MIALRLALVFAFFSAVGSGGADASDAFEVLHFEELQSLRVASTKNAYSGKTSSAAQSELAFTALGKSYVLELEPNSALLTAEFAAESPVDIQVYRGRISGTPDSWARITIAHGQPSGLIWDGRELFAIEAPGDSGLAVDAPVIFRLADVVVSTGALSCGDLPQFSQGSDVFKALAGEIQVAAAHLQAAGLQMGIGAVGDFEFYQAKGANAASIIASRLNNVDGIFTEQVGVQLPLRANVVFSTADDPFTSTTDAGALLSELSQFRRNSPEQTAQGLTHLFTGRDLDGSSVGLANIGLLCNNRFSVSLTQGTIGATLESLIAAHEIGHNFGAPHDAESGSPCQAVPSGYLMAPTINSSVSEFSACSLTQMQPVIDGAACIAQPPRVDLTVSLPSQSASLLLGDEASFEFSIRNTGTADATGVGVVINLPDNALIRSAAGPGDGCTLGAGIVNCSPGMIAGGQSVVITVDAQASMVGDSGFAISVTADADDEPGNNSADMPVFVLPAVDLGFTSVESIQLAVNQAGAISVIVANASSLDATQVSIVATFDQGVRVDSAGWPSGSCSVNGQQLACNADRLPANSSTTLSLAVTGTLVGQRSFQASIVAAETDRDMSNNSAVGRVSVVSGSGGGAGGSDSSSGGGAFDLGLLFTAFVFARRRKMSIRFADRLFRCG